MNVAVKARMTVGQYLEWAKATAPEGRYELVDGEVVKMSPEQARHVRTKLTAVVALKTAIARAKLSCEAFADGMTVVIDEHKARQPDASVQCAPVDPDSLVLDQPVIVLEVLSPSSRRSDTGEKLAEYFSVASIRHYLIVNPVKHLIIHHARSAAGAIETRIIETGGIDLSPPGMALTVEEILGEEGQ
jgi:Uma2 family endonuclease